MDAPPHESMEELADMAGSKDSEEGAEKMRQWHLHCVGLIPEQQRTSSMRVSTMTAAERRANVALTREEKDEIIIRATARRLGQAQHGAKIIYTDGGGGEVAGWGACVTRKGRNWAPDALPKVIDEERERGKR
eukprot:COSAG02_NODE_8980_length_2374_cov_1.366154_1_plen_133_part_00